jgi:hypothetical protein
MLSDYPHYGLFPRENKDPSAINLEGIPLNPKTLQNTCNLSLLNLLGKLIERRELLKALS